MPSHHPVVGFRTGGSLAPIPVSFPPIGARVPNSLVRHALYQHPPEVRPLGDESRHATRSSRWTHRLSDATTHSTATISVVVALGAWIVIGAGYDFPTWWSTTLFSVSAAVTLLMVFAIQHTQARLEIATQRKLDEVLRALPDADARLIAAEVATDEELAHLGAEQLETRRAAVEPD